VSAIKMLSIEIDGHFHGSPDVPKPWVAQILGPCPKFGLQRKFVQNLNDWSDASVAMSGNVYGRVARFPLRSGHIYEVSRLRGRSSKRYVSREFLLVDGSEQTKLDAPEALARIVGPGVEFRIPEDKDCKHWVARITGLGTPRRQGFVVVGDERLYLLDNGLYEVMRDNAQRFIGVEEGAISRLRTETEAIEWLKSH
jgi:hypothetical protein